MTISALQIGLDPDLIDYASPDFAQFPGLNATALRAANDDNILAMREAGYVVENCLIPADRTALDMISAHIDRMAFDAVLIGAGVRLVAANTLLFEAVVNLVHQRLPGARFVFNYAAKATPDDIRRWYPDPEMAPEMTGVTA
jgi:hypothetical protein